MAEPLPASGGTRVGVLGEAIVDVVDPADRHGPPTPHPGGSPLNVAIGLARLEQPTSFLGRLAHDEYGLLLRAHAAQSGVDLTHAVDADEPSTVARVDLDEHGAAQYKFTVDGTADFAWTDAELAAIPDGFRVVHFGSLTSWLSPGAEVVDRWVAELRADGRTLVSYDPNVRPQLQPDPAAARVQVERSIRHAHVVKASDEDVRYLYGDEPAESVAGRWLRAGPVLIVITRGAAGPLAVTAAATLTRPGHLIEVVDTVGAGDAFTSGLLDALVRLGVSSPGRLAALDTAGLVAALDAASLVAAITCSRASADPPTRAELRNRSETQDN